MTQSDQSVNVTNSSHSGPNWFLFYINAVFSVEQIADTITQL